MQNSCLLNIQNHWISLFLFRDKQVCIDRHALEFIVSICLAVHLNVWAKMVIVGWLIHMYRKKIVFYRWTYSIIHFLVLKQILLDIENIINKPAYYCLSFCTFLSFPLTCMWNHSPVHSTLWHTRMLILKFALCVGCFYCKLLLSYSLIICL